MSITTYGKFKFDCTIIKVEDRWYICSEAHYVSDAPMEYVYTTPTLRFKTTSNGNGLNIYYLNGIKMESIGHKNSLKLEYR